MRGRWRGEEKGKGQGKEGEGGAWLEKGRGRDTEDRRCR